MKSKCLFVTFLLIISRFVPINVYAQPGMFGADLNRAMSVQNLRFNTLNYANRAWVYNGESLPQHKYTYDVELKDGTKEKISSKIYMDTVTRQAYLLRLDTKKGRKSTDPSGRIYAAQTRYISRRIGIGVLEHFGIATDSCWLFRVNHGRLKAYSFLSERVGLDSFYLTAFQVEDGPIRAFDIKELEKIIADHPKAMKAFRKKDYYKAILTFNR